MSAAKDITLNDGNMLPSIGFGTFPQDGNDSEMTTLRALEYGYRLLDTALSYGNESAVGRAIAGSEVPREEIIVTTKLPGRYQGYKEAKRGLYESLENLQLEYVDLYIIHWPLPRLNKYTESWRMLAELKQEGLIRSIGVSNFTSEHIERLVRETGILPTVNQIELHPYFAQQEQRDFHTRHGIVTESWSPLGRGGKLLKEPAITAIANSHNVSPAQVILRWHIQLGAVPIPKSADALRQQQNLEIFGFALDETQMKTITSLEQGRIWCQDPNVYEEF